MKINRKNSAYLIQLTIIITLSNFSYAANTINPNEYIFALTSSENACKYFDLDEKEKIIDQRARIICDKHVKDLVSYETTDIPSGLFSLQGFLVGEEGKLLASEEYGYKAWAYRREAPLDAQDAWDLASMCFQIILRGGIAYCCFTAREWPYPMRDLSFFSGMYTLLRGDMLKYFFTTSRRLIRRSFFNSELDHGDVENQQNIHLYRHEFGSNFIPHKIFTKIICAE